MANEWVVRVWSSGKEVTNAHVCLAPEHRIDKRRINWNLMIPEEFPPTHTSDGSGFYRPTSLPNDLFGEWRLIVRAPGKSPVIQPLTILPAPNGRGYVTSTRDLTGAGAGREAATVEIKTVSYGKVTATNVHVELHPQREIVLMSGTQYEEHDDQAGRTGKEPFRKFCEVRRDDLRAAGEIDDGTIVTLFSCDDRKVEVSVAAKGGGWTLVHQLEPLPLPKNYGEITPGRPWPFDLDARDRHLVLHIEDLYEYLSWVGREESLRVHEVSIFSHAFRNGPILYNTWEYRGEYFERTPAVRDPDDYDARPRDFDAANAKRWPHLRHALAKKGKWHIWGCAENSELVMLSADATQARRHSVPELEPFAYDNDVWDGRCIGRVSRTRVLQLHSKWLASKGADEERSYAGTLCAAIDRSVIGPAPGTWSQFGNGHMFVARDGSFETIQTYMRREPHLDSRLAFTTGMSGRDYIDYKRFRGMVIPDVPATSEQYELKSFKGIDPAAQKEDGKSPSFVRQYRILFHGGLVFRKIGRVRRVDTEALADVATLARCPKPFAGKPGHLHVIREHHDEDSVAFLAIVVDHKVRVFGIERAADGSFSAFTHPLDELRTTMRRPENES